MTITLFDVILVVLSILWIVVMYGIISRNKGKRHQDDGEGKRHWPFHHA